MTIEMRLSSSHLGNERSIWIREPQDPEASADLVVFLDAELYRDRVGVMSIIERLHGRIADAWFVFVSEESPESRRLECACHLPFSRFIVEELLPFLETNSIDRDHVQRRSLVGLSYTGLAAAAVAKDFPAAFQKIICQSGSFWWNDCWLVDEYKRSNVRGPSEFYLDVGSLETQENVDHGFVFQAIPQLEGVRRFRDVLSELEHPVRYREFDGGHDYRCWAATLPNALEWCLPVASAELRSTGDAETLALPGSGHRR